MSKEYYEANKGKWKEYYESRKKKVGGSFSIPTSYRDGKIYKIVCHESDEIYIGSTKENLRSRISKHRYDAKHRGDLASCQIILRNNYSIELIEDFPCESARQLSEREQYWIDRSECVNIQPAHRSDEVRKAYNKKWAQDHKDERNLARRQIRMWGDFYYIDTSLFL